MLPPNGAIEDPAVVLPLPIHALVDSSAADNAIASALLAKGNSVLGGAILTADTAAEARGEARGKIEGKAEGTAEGRVEALFAVLAARGISISTGEQATIHSTSNRATLSRWIARAIVFASVEELFNSEDWVAPEVGDAWVALVQRPRERINIIQRCTRCLPKQAWGLGRLPQRNKRWCTAQSRSDCHRLRC